MHPYRSAHCGDLTIDSAGKSFRLCGWLHRKRDHGGLLFVDLRDSSGIMQTVVETGSALFSELESISVESTLHMEGKLVKRSDDTINPNIPTGYVELRIESFQLLGSADPLPFPVNQDAGYPEDIRLRFRYLDLRREEIHRNIILRSKIISSIRRRMDEQGFLELQTPILTATSPEGARDFLVPSRLHPGKFYALPQAPQQFKQLFMMSGFERYYQIAPCFRDEDARADRSPGEFYQLDLEMAFVTQDDVFNALEPVMAGIFEEFRPESEVTKVPFPRIPYHEAMLRYGSDKPDLRNPLVIDEVTDCFRDSTFRIFAAAINGGAVVRAIRVPQIADQPRSFFDRANAWARSLGQKGLGYMVFRGAQEGATSAPTADGPIAKNLGADRITDLAQKIEAQPGDAVFFVCGREKEATEFAGHARTWIAEQLELIARNVFRFCWITDYPMYEKDQETGEN